jgi:hypothetical protein
MRFLLGIIFFSSVSFAENVTSHLTYTSKFVTGENTVYMDPAISIYTDAHTSSKFVTLVKTIRLDPKSSADGACIAFGHKSGSLSGIANYSIYFDFFETVVFSKKGSVASIQRCKGEVGYPCAVATALSCH